MVAYPASERQGAAATSASGAAPAATRSTWRGSSAGSRSRTPRAWSQSVSGIYGLDGLEEPQEVLQPLDRERAPLGDDVYAIAAAAQRFFADALGSDGDGAAEARDYLQDRGIGPEVANHFGVGFAPPAWSVLLDELVALGASEAAVVEAGLARNRKPKPETQRHGAGRSGADRSAVGRNAQSAASGATPRQAYDLFRGRITFPLLASDVEEEHGRARLGPFRPAGFGGRIVPGLEGSKVAAEVPKYMNSPDSQHYSKGEILFGLPQATAALEQQDQVVALVEGYLDVLALAEAGIPAVAPCGTSFSAEQAARLRAAGARRVLVLFDDDAAGRAATRPAVEKLLAAGMLPLVGRLSSPSDADRSRSEGDSVQAADPAEVLVKSGPQELRRRVEASPLPVVHYVLGDGYAAFEKNGATGDGGSAPGASVAGAFQSITLRAPADDVFVKASRAAETIALSPEPLVRGVIAREVGLALGVPFDAVLAHVFRAWRAGEGRWGPAHEESGFTTRCADAA